MKLFALLCAPIIVFASQILSYNIYDRSDRVDIMLTFDTPYEGVIRQQKQSKSIIVKLDDASIDAPKTKELKSPFLNKVTLTSAGTQTQIIARVPDGIAMQASRTSDAYGLRLRFLKEPLSSSSILSEPATTTAPFGALPTKKANEFDSSYITVITILVIGIFIILWLKRSLNQTSKTPSVSSLFKKATQKNVPEGAMIRFQKALDQNNSVLMLDYADASYLVIIGSTNLVLDKFHDNKPVSQNDFETLLSNKEEELERYLQIDRVNASEVLQSYKEKASQ
jgi:hypothetical protein